MNYDAYDWKSHREKELNLSKDIIAEMKIDYSKLIYVTDSDIQQLKDKIKRMREVYGFSEVEKSEINAYETKLEKLIKIRNSQCPMK